MHSETWILESEIVPKELKALKKSEKKRRQGLGTKV